MTARVAAARRIGWPVVFGKPGVLDVERPVTREELAVARVTRRHDAIEHVDTARDTFDQVNRGADTHEVSWLACRQERGGQLDGAIHFLAGLTNAESTDGIAFEADTQRLLHTARAKLRRSAALNDSKLDLSRIAANDGSHALVSNAQEPCTC